jgi:hypothetical protein
MRASAMLAFVATTLACGGRTADRSGAADEVGLCPQSKVAGTCAASFFAPVTACFKASGKCAVAPRMELPEQIRSTTCWTSGAELLLDGDITHYQDVTTWRSGGSTCMTGRWAGGPKGYSYEAGSATLVYDALTGKAVCPDGSSADIGDVKDCPELSALLNADQASCEDGACPIR